MTVIRQKRVLITGAGRGLGRALAHRFAAAGAEVIAADRDETGLAETVQTVGEKAFGYALDVTSAAAVSAVRDRVHADRGPIDILVNNAGVVFGGDFLSVPVEKHRATIEVNLIGVLNVTHAFMPDLLARPAGHVVNVASASAVLALPWAASYAASKWAVLGFSDSLREELRVQGRRHVWVTTVCPSYIATGLFDGAKPARLTWLLTPDAVAASVLRAVERNRDTVILPWTAQLLYSAFRGMPRRLYYRIAALFGVSTSMIEWKGRS